MPAPRPSSPPSFILETLSRRRAAQVASHLDAARKAFQTQYYEETVAACENVLMLDEDDTEALEKLKKSKQKENLITDTIPFKKNDADVNQLPVATLPDRQRKSNIPDTVK